MLQKKVKRDEHAGNNIEAIQHNKEQQVLLGSYMKVC
jgi:hypothetical protein